MILTAYFESNMPIVLPIGHQYALQAMLYHSLSASPDVATYIHDEGFAKQKKKFKLFTFGKLRGLYQIENKTISFPKGKVSLEIRSPSEEIIHLWTAAFISDPNVILLGNHLLASEVQLTKTPDFTQNSIHIRMNTPMVAYLTENKKTTFYSPEQSRFVWLVDQNFRSKYEAASGNPPDAGVFIEPISVKKRNTTFKQTSITGYEGEFSLSGKPEYLRFLFDAGIGAKNSCGFGMFEVV